MSGSRLLIAIEVLDRVTIPLGDLLTDEKGYSAVRLAARRAQVADQIGRIYRAEFGRQLRHCRRDGSGIVRRHRVPVPEDDAGMGTFFRRPLPKQVGNRLLIIR